MNVLQSSLNIISGQSVVSLSNNLQFLFGIVAPLRHFVSIKSSLEIGRPGYIFILLLFFARSEVRFMNKISLTQSLNLTSYYIM